MSLFITSLNSGSNGNCYYIGNQDEAVLIDGGLSCKETEKRMKRLQLSMKKVKAIFVSHEHTDHIFGVGSLSKKYQLPVYITDGTLQHGRLRVQQHLLISFRAHEPVSVGNLSVTAFPKIHDAFDPHSFMVEGNGVKVGIFTDIGKPCENVITHFEQCHAAFLEANYDEDLLETGSYPLYLKNRIRGGRGHLSNTQALQLFMRHKASHLSHLLLSHLSANNNTPEIVKELFHAIAGKTEVIIAPRTHETPLYDIRNRPVRLGERMKAKAPRKELQLSLF